MKLNHLPAPHALVPRDAATDAAWQQVYEAACALYRPPGWLAAPPQHWPWHWARGKLARDPAFRAMLERGDLPAAARVVDIGCGQGLVAALLHGCAVVAARGGWPAAWPAAPSALAYTGIELMARDADRARAALHALPFAPQVVCADMCQAALPACDVVVILDVLHYVDHEQQLGVLRRVRDALAPGGRLLLRVGDRASPRRFTVSQWVDRVVTLVRGHRVSPMWGRTLSEWKALLQGLGFTVRSAPMSQGLPLANVLLVADLPR